MNIKIPETLIMILEKILQKNKRNMKIKQCIC